jgi:hypothetical protein
MLISLTRLRVRSWRFLPGFLLGTFRAQRQAVRAAGFRGGRLLVDANRAYWTLTAWEDEAAMRAYRASGAHGKVMPRLLGWCDEAAVLHWTAETADLPDWTAAHRRMVAEGRPSRVDHPSPDHQTLRIPPPRLQPLIGQNLAPQQP